MFHIDPAVTYWSTFQLLVARSKTFRQVTQVWADRPRDSRIAIRFYDFAKRHPSLRRAPAAHTFFEKSIAINKEKLYYFSDQGLTELTFLRRHAGAMVDYFIGEILPEKYSLVLQEPLMERGLAVLLENEVMVEAGEKSPRRICAEISRNPDSYLRYESAVSRAADSEDGYLRTMTPAGETLSENAAANEISN